MMPTLLIDICIDFIAKNIDKVDTLAGIPEHLGHKIFLQVVKYHKSVFCDSESALSIIKLFNECYMSTFMVYLCLNNSPWFIKYRQQELTSFQYLKMVDLSGNNLQGDEPLVKSLFISNSLETLILKDNNINNKTLGMSTLSVRIKPTGNHHLTSIDLTGNEGFNSDGLRYLSGFSKLQRILLDCDQFKKICSTRSVAILDLWISSRNQDQCSSASSLFYGLSKKEQMHSKFESSSTKPLSVLQCKTTLALYNAKAIDCCACSDNQSSSIKEDTYHKAKRRKLVDPDDSVYGKNDAMECYYGDDTMYQHATSLSTAMSKW